MIRGCLGISPTACNQGTSLERKLFSHCIASVINQRLVILCEREILLCKNYSIH